MKAKLLVPALGAILLACSTAGAAVTKDQGKCQAGAAKAAVAMFTAQAKALAACHDAIGRGELSLLVDCHGEAADALGDASSRFAAAVAKACSDATVASLRYAGSCEAASSTTALTACLGSTQEQRTDAFVARLYSDAALPGGDGIACREAASREARKFAAKALGALDKCKNAASKDKIAVGARCEDDVKLLASVEKLRAKLEGKIGAACSAVAIAAAAFGDACDAATSAADLADCMLAGSNDISAATAPAAYGDGGLCGDAHNGVEGRVQATIDEMSPLERVRLMAGKDFAAAANGWLTPSVSRLGIPSLAMVDGPRGVGKYVGNATAFPVGMARGASWDPDLERRVGEAIGAETRAKGASVILAPTVNLLRHPRWGRAQETYGEDPLLLGRMGEAFVEGAQQHVMASVKHFAVNSIEDTRFSVDVSIDERTLREIYLPHFRRIATDGEAASVMSAYNSVNGLHCDENAHLLTDILKEEWGFRGFVESDWYLGTHSTVDSALAGLDIEMPGPNFFGESLLKPAVDSNQVPLSVIDESARRKLRQIFCFRLDSDRPVADATAIETPAHLALAQEAAEKGIVLLKNDAAALPITGAAPSIAVVGALAAAVNLGDSGSSDVTPSSSVTLLQGIVARNSGGIVTFIDGDPNETANAAAIASADLAIVVTGLTKDDEGESLISAGDRDSYDLPADRQQLIHDVAARNGRTVVVLEGGSAIGVEGWIDEVEALVMAWYPGMEGGTAVARVLFGDVNPSGKLPLVWAKTDADLPPFVNDQNAVSYGYWHGYRLLDHDGKDPRFAFGHGLSYTSYAYSNLAIANASLHDADTLTVSFDVTNSGSRAGEEVAQLYVSYPETLIERPLRDLRAFERVALEPGETKTLTLTVPVADLAWYDPMAPGWALEHAGYGVEVGGSSRDLPLSGSFELLP